MEIKRPIQNQPIPHEAELVFKGILFDTYQWKQKQFDGSYKTFEKLKRPDTAVVIPVTEDKKIIIIEQEQPGKHKFISFPGGRLDKSESPKEGSLRELKEETGYTSDELISLDAIQPQTKIDWVVYFIIARRCRKVGEQNLDAGELINMKLVTFDELVELIINGTMVEEQELTSIFMKAKIFPDEMKRLRDLILG